MNPFTILSAVQQDYLTYVQTFQRFQNPQIRDWVLERVRSGTLLWKPPFIQVSRPSSNTPYTWWAVTRKLTTRGPYNSRCPTRRCRN